MSLAHTRTPVVVIAALWLCPSAALACGACTDSSLLMRGWWMALPVWLAAALVVEGAVFWGWSRWRKKQPRHLGKSILGALAAGAIGLVLGLGSILACALASAVLLGSLVRFLIRPEPFEPCSSTRIKLSRAALLLATLALLGVRNRPAGQATQSLIGRAMFLPGWAGLKVTWIEEELSRRPEAASLVESELRAKAGDPPERDDVDARLLRLHFLIGGSAAARAPYCRVVENRPPGLDAEAATRICGAVARAAGD